MMPAFTSWESIEDIASLFDAVLTLMLELVRRLTSAPQPDQTMASARNSLLIR